MAAPAAAPAAPRRYDTLPPGYKWIALSNTTLGVLMATLNLSITLISLPAIFRGIGVNPLAPGEIGYLLWMLLGYMIVTSAFLVTFGRISDLYGRVRLYNLGFAVFTLGSLLLFLTPGRGNGAALAMILFRLVQGIGGAFLFANGAAILTDAFPPAERGLAMGINQIAATAGSLLGLILGGVLATVWWRGIFLVSVPLGLAGTVWAYTMLRETAVTTARQPIDYAGNLTFALGLTALLVGVTYGIQPYGGGAMGWSNPLVLGALAAGALLLWIFVRIETTVPAPMFRLELFRIRMFTAANISAFLASLANGGLQFMLIIWLQGVWLPLRGVPFARTPLDAAIAMIPLMAGFLVAGPLCGWLSDRHGARAFATVGMLLLGTGFLALRALPVDFHYGPFAVVLFAMGCGMGMFAAPNTTAIMNAVPAEHRGAGSGMRATFQNSANMLSIGVFFSIAIVGLAGRLPPALDHGLTRVGVPAAAAATAAHLPPTAALFAAFLGYNPLRHLLPTGVLATLPQTTAARLVAPPFFPGLIAPAFSAGLGAAFLLAAALAGAGATASLLRGRRFIHGVDAAAHPAAGPDADRGQPRISPSA